MKKFKCQNCGGGSHSSADLEHQINPMCIACGSKEIKEVPDGQ